jgi:hypothetical protein
MTPESSHTRSWYLWAIIALLAGLVIGLIIAWGIWPVSYKNALPQDMRPAERDTYLSMVAESYGATGDLQLAQTRLETWPTEELATALATLQERLLTTDPQAATEVEALAGALNLGAAAPRPAAAAARSSGSTVPWKTLCTSALWVLLVLTGVAALAYLFKRWRAARQRRGGPAIASTAQAPAQARSPEEIARQEKEEWPPETSTAAEPGTTGESYLYDQESDGVDAAPAFIAAREVYQPPAQPSAPPAPRPMPVDTSHRPPTPAPAPSAAKVGDFMAIFQMGEPDYDEAFDINDPVDGYMGQCGLQLNEPVGSNRDQAVALQAWLWDSSDPDTRTKVLMSEGAYRDTALRAQQAGAHEVVQVRAGTEFELESHDLLLRGRVEKTDYTDQEPYRGVFAELQVRMQVYRKS